ncbi:MAG TPA: ABC transporter permease [Thermoanaerobaculia bacterium]|nr:ABC transporter permease [Thermoanaerobaculia bacterium]
MPTEEPAPKPSDLAASLRRVRKDFGAVAALTDLDLDLPRGTVTALLGPNGAGKSTLLHLLSGRLAPSGGTIAVLGVADPATAGKRERNVLRRDLGFVPQDLALDPEMTGRETLDLLAALHGVPRPQRPARIAEIAAAFRLEKPLDRPVATWSGGQKRRLHLAAGMIHDPALLLLDEPTAGLDAEGTAMLWKELARRAAQGVSVVISTHDHVAAEAADRVAKLEGGRLAALTPAPSPRGRGETSKKASAVLPSPSGRGAGGEGWHGKLFPFDAIRAVARRTTRAVLRRPVLLTFSLGQPLIWMLFFGFLFHRFQLDPTGHTTYLDYLAPGVSVMTLLFGASQSGIGWIRDLQTGFLPRLLAAPAGPAPILAGKLAADVARLVVQALVVLLLARLLGAHLVWAPAATAIALLDLALFATAFAALSSILAFVTRSQEGMATFVHLVNMPLFFTSTALVPHRAMPDWLAAIARFNPLSLTVDAWRGALLSGERPGWAGMVALLVLAGFGCSVALALMRRAGKGM